MFGLYLADTPDMDQFVSQYCLRDTFRLLPCICVVRNNVCDILWVGERIRRRGFGTELVTSLGVKCPNEIVNNSHAFWRSVNMY